MEKNVLTTLTVSSIVQLVEVIIMTVSQLLFEWQFVTICLAFLLFLMYVYSGSHGKEHLTTLTVSSIVQLPQLKSLSWLCHSCCLNGSLLLQFVLLFYSFWCMCTLWISLLVKAPTPIMPFSSCMGQPSHFSSVSFGSSCSSMLPSLVPHFLMQALIPSQYMDQRNLECSPARWAGRTKLSSYRRKRIVSPKSRHKWWNK